MNKKAALPIIISTFFVILIILGVLIFEKKLEDKQYVGNSEHKLIYNPKSKLTAICIDEREPECRELVLPYSTLKHLTEKQLKRNYGDVCGKVSESAVMLG